MKACAADQRTSRYWVPSRTILASVTYSAYFFWLLTNSSRMLSSFTSCDSASAASGAIRNGLAAIAFINGSMGEGMGGLCVNGPHERQRTAVRRLPPVRSIGYAPPGPDWATSAVFIEPVTDLLIRPAFRTSEIGASQPMIGMKQAATIAQATERFGSTARDSLYRQKSGQTNANRPTRATGAAMTVPFADSAAPPYTKPAKRASGSSKETTSFECG